MVPAEDYAPALPPLGPRSATAVLWTFSAGCRGRVANHPSGHPFSLPADTPPLQMQPIQALKHKLIFHTSRERDYLLFNSLTCSKSSIKL